MIEVSKTKIKTLFVQVRSRGDALYKSSIVKMNSKVQKNFDPLKYILQWSKLLNLNIHAWVNTYLIWSSPYTPDDSLHLYYSNPEWFESDYNGRSDISININKVQSPNWEGLYLSPNNSEVNIYLLNLIKELVSNYSELDGVHFDYIRYQNQYFGFNKKGIQEFELKHEFNPKDIYRGLFTEKFGWTKTQQDSIKNLWIEYNSKNITNLLTEINLYKKLNDLDLTISAAVKSNILEAKKKWYQDWKFWIESGIVDFVVPMNYSINKNEFLNNIKLINEHLSIDNLNEKVVIGIALYNQSDFEIVDKIILSNLSGFNRVCFFSYNTIKNKSNILNSINSIYKEKMYILGE